MQANSLSRLVRRRWNAPKVWVALLAALGLGLILSGLEPQTRGLVLVLLLLYGLMAAIAGLYISCALLIERRRGRRRDARSRP